MRSFTALLSGLLLVASAALAAPTTKSAEQPVVTYLGSQGRILSGGASTTKGLVFTSGTIPSFNGTVVEGGIGPQTAQVIKNIEVILKEAGSSLDYILKTTVYLADMNDYAAMNEVYASMLPDPKPGRTAVQVGKLPGNFLVEIEAIAAIPDS